MVFLILFLWLKSQIPLFQSWGHVVIACLFAKKARRKESGYNRSELTDPRPPVIKPAGSQCFLCFHCSPSPSQSHRVLYITSSLTILQFILSLSHSCIFSTTCEASRMITTELLIVQPNELQFTCKFSNSQNAGRPKNEIFTPLFLDLVWFHSCS